MNQTTVKNLTGRLIVTTAETIDILSGVLPYDVGFFFGWIKLDVAEGQDIDEITVGWKVVRKDPLALEEAVEELDVYLRPIFIDTNRAAENYDTPNYQNMNDVVGAGLGTLLVDGEWYPFILFDPANPVPIPLIGGNDQIQFTVTGLGMGGIDEWDISIRLLSEANALSYA